MRTLFLTLITPLLVLPAYAKYNGGTGKPNDPYQIATAADLIALGDTPEDYDKHFILTADIDLDPNLPGRKVFDKAVIGGFSGVLDGDGHTVSRLTIRDANSYGSGLFGVLGALAKVKNLGVADANVRGSAFFAGMLAGENRGTVTRCCSSGAVNSEYAVGGIVGHNDRGTVTQCYSTSVVTGRDRYAGGLIGYNRGHVSACYAAGHVTAEQDTADVGGLVGSRGSSDASYFLALVEDRGGPDNGNGTVLTDAQMRQQNSFEGWDFYGTDTDGTEDPWFMPQGLYPVLSWQTEITGLRQVPDVTGLTVEQARSRLEAAGLVVGDIEYVHTKGITKSGVMSTDPGASRYAPLGSPVDIVFEVGPYDWGQNPGDGSKANPYQIQTADHVDALRERPEVWGKSFVLTSDIDLQGETYVGYVAAASFAGSFNGNGHRIMNLVIQTSPPSVSPGSRSRGGASAAPLGFFGTLGPDARISGLTLENVEISYSGNTAGLLASANSGTIVDCNTSGAVKNADEGGGLVGRNGGTITNCRSSASVSAAQAGGLVGTNDGTIVDCRASGPVTVGVPGMVSRAGGGLVGVNRGSLLRCWATGAVAGSVWKSLDTQGAGVGGLAGLNSGSIVSCLATGSVQGTFLLGGLVGANRGSVTDSYAIGLVSGRDYVGGLAGTNYTYYVEWTKDQWGWPVQGFAYSPGTITRCYSTGPVTFDDAYPQGHYGGALVGSNSEEWERWGYGGKVQYKCNGTISSDSYFLVPPDGNAPVNGLGAPLTLPEMTQQSSFSSWDFYGSTSDGPADTWFMTQSSPPVLSWQTDLTGLRTIPDIAGMTQEQAKAAIEKAGFVPAGIRYAYDRTVSIGMALCTYPWPYAPAGSTLEIVLNALYDWATNPGDGTEGNPYQIETTGHLEALADSPDLWSKHFVLTQDIDMTGRTYAGALIGRRIVVSPDVPIGEADQTASASGTWEAFTGTFDGQDHAISSFSIVADPSVGCPASGLFSSIGEAGKVCNLRLENAAIDANEGGPEFLGLLAGSNSGVISQCGVAGRVNGRARYVGGLVGLNGGTIERSYADTRVWSLCNGAGLEVVGDVGGLVGRNAIAGTIRDCFSIGGVRGCEVWVGTFNVSAGGLVGRDLAIERDPYALWHCYSASSVVGTNAGGLVGTGYNYFGGEYLPTFGEFGGVPRRYSVSGFFLSPSDGGGRDNGLGEPLSAAQMRQQSSFLGWDFVGEADNDTEDIWLIDYGQGYPRLSWEPRPPYAFSPSPRNGAHMILPVVLTWRAGARTAGHDVYLGEDRTVVAGATAESLGVYRGRLPAEVTTYDPGGLGHGKTYYWRIEEVNDADPSGYYKGDVWTFTTADIVKVPNPSDGATGIEQSPVLSWAFGGPGLLYDVYFGEEENAVASGTPASAGIYRGRQVSVTFKPGVLELNRTYYWRIEEVESTNPQNVLPGNVWRFTTSVSGRRTR